ncbi:MAG: molybdenum cofactor biosynthesis protein B [Haloarculaceae archaeon]
MVDFQSRNTRRGHDDDATGTDDKEGANETDETDDGRETSEAETPETETGETPDSTGVAVVAVGDAEDTATEAVVGAIESGGNEIAIRERLRAEHDGVQQRVDALVDRRDTVAVVTVGGVGVGADDVTVEAVAPLFEKDLPGFGELFRLLAHDALGTGIVSVRATGGIADGTPVLCLPGDESSARLGAEQIVAEELDALIEQAG